MEMKPKMGIALMALRKKGMGPDSEDEAPDEDSDTSDSAYESAAEAIASAIIQKDAEDIKHSLMTLIGMLS